MKQNSTSETFKWLTIGSFILAVVFVILSVISYAIDDASWYFWVAVGMAAFFFIIGVVLLISHELTKSKKRQIPPTPTNQQITPACNQSEQKPVYNARSLNSLAPCV